MRRHPIQRRPVSNLPAEKATAISAVAVDDQPLLAVVHAQREAGAAAFDHLHAEQAGGELRPVRELVADNADISETLQFHRRGSKINARGQPRYFSAVTMPLI